MAHVDMLSPMLSCRLSADLALRVPWNQLPVFPVEILLSILSYLHPLELWRLRSVSRTFDELCTTTLLTKVRDEQWRIELSAATYSFYPIGHYPHYSKMMLQCTGFHRERKTCIFRPQPAHVNCFLQELPPNTTLSMQEISLFLLKWLDKGLRTVPRRSDLCPPIGYAYPSHMWGSYLNAATVCACPPYHHRQYLPITLSPYPHITYTPEIALRYHVWLRDQERCEACENEHCGRRHTAFVLVDEIEVAVSWLLDGFAQKEVDQMRVFDPQLSY
ncbi:hypothetical protein BZG36_04386 [Bifiguratus adelaidae]|uniref:F-box domain-containing protein n=1 Tax=Bifiguratus adelaidae TaxID=1938954 RepID=A0A261XVI7_9FUNG|nr:hypothetical protein BZG36_04386 [Bifiguratus adelaidae]